MHGLVEGNVQAVWQDDTPVGNGTAHTLKEFARRERTIGIEHYIAVCLLSKGCPHC